jgi:hypothetical protein
MGEAKDRAVDERFARMVAGENFKSETLAKNKIEEAETAAAEALVELLDQSVPPSTRLSAARYILELNGHTPGAQKTKTGTDAFIERLTRGGPVEADVEVSPEAKRVLEAAQKQAETLAAKRKAQKPIEPPVEMEPGVIPEVVEFPEIESEVEGG